MQLPAFEHDESEQRGGSWRAAVATYGAIAAALLPLLLVVRGFEQVLVRMAHELPPGTGGAFARGLRSDVVLTLWAAALALPTVAIARWAPRVGATAHRALIVAVLLASVALAQYFALTLVPLGGDLFGYTLEDVVKTVAASRGVGAAALIAFVLVSVLTWGVTAVARRRIAMPALGIGLAALSPLSIARRDALPLRPRDFDSDVAYHLAENKTVFFVDRSLRLLEPGDIGPPITGYPLLRASGADDVLGPLLNLGSEPPHIVVLIVEGLGRDFVGPGASMGGFMPFLDSLATRSLYWENFLSAAGRTFGVAPAVFGSLPFGREGFMSLGAAMPSHRSLLRLVREEGYVTRYLTGTNGQFDGIDVFMERQGIDKFVDQSAYGPDYERQPAEQGGVSWGYGDAELFRRSLELTPATSSAPRFDVHHTVTMHEPFIPPKTAQYMAAFERRLATLRVSARQRAEFRKYANVFATLLYTDDALRYFLTEHAKRPDHARTLFVITGDHRLIPVPQATRLSRFHVPLMIHSPMVKAPRRMASVSSHLDITPSLLAMLEARYGMAFPDSSHWLGTGLDTAVAFRNVHSLALMRTKNQLEEYVDGRWLLSGDQLFALDEGLALRPSGNDSVHAALTRRLDRFRRVNDYVTSGDRLYPPTAQELEAARRARSDDSAYVRLRLGQLSAQQAYGAARERAFAGRRDEARVILRRVLRASPSYHDARVLLGRTWSWDKRYDEARTVLDDLTRRAPDYADGFAARADVQLWDGDAAGALAIAGRGLRHSPGDPGLLFARARAEEALGRRAAALRTLDSLRVVAPNYEGAAPVRARLSR